MKRVFAFAAAATILFAACSKGNDDSQSSHGNSLLEIGARIENLDVKSVADPSSGKIRFEHGDEAVIDNGAELGTYFWNSSRNAFVPKDKALEASGQYSAAFPASKAGGSTVGNLVLDAPSSMELEGTYIKDLPLIGEFRDGVLVFKPYTEVVGPKPHVQQGSGTVSDPYIVSTWEDIQTLLEKGADNAYSTAFFKQTASIELPYNFRFTPVPEFKGSYDGGGFSISGINFKNSVVGHPSGFFASLDGAVVKNLNLESVNFVSDQMFLGGIAGKAVGATIENCSVSGYMKSTARFTWEEWDNITTDKMNHGFTGGIVGYAEGSTVKDCTFSGELSSFGKNTGCIAGFITDKTTVEGCTAAQGAEAYSGYHCVGGIVGAVTGGSSVKNSSSLAAVSSTGYGVGGIVGYLQDGSVEDCVTSSKANLACRQYYVGGIVGGVLPRSGHSAAIKGCVAYSDVQGQYNVGGIAGAVDTQAGSAASIKDCAFIGGTLYGTGTNSKKYSLIGGIVGYVISRDAVQIENCAALPSLVKASIQNSQTGSDSATCIGGVGGILGFQSQDGITSVKNSYSNIEKSRVLVRYKAIESYSDTFVHYGAIYGGGGSALELENCFRDASLADYVPGETAKEGCSGIAPAAFTDGTLLQSLGGGWVDSASGFPVPGGLKEDPSPRETSAKRVSVIGDSISSFAGYIPAGYNYHYPCNDGSVTQVSQTYWYQLIYNHLKNAELDLNMSYSGSAVTRSTDESRKNNHWYDNCYIQRYLRQGGVGNPDIVLIHGGTNDWAHNDCPLYPGDEVKCHNAEAPGEDVYSSVFAKADAAASYDDAAGLPDTDFLSAYVELIKLLKVQYPEVKIVCIVGDYLSEGVEQCILNAAEHYGAKSVNLLRVNGFNDQTYMPKHDFNGTGGCHPDARAMEFISDKIYKELGSWLEN